MPITQNEMKMLRSLCDLCHMTSAVEASAKEALIAYPESDLCAAAYKDAVETADHAREVYQAATRLYDSR